MSTHVFDLSSVLARAGGDAQRVVVTPPRPPENANPEARRLYDQDLANQIYVAHVFTTAEIEPLKDDEAHSPTGWPHLTAKGDVGEWPVSLAVARELLDLGARYRGPADLRPYQRRRG